MTKDELLQALGKNTGDPERDHWEAEESLVAYVNDPEITDAWKRARDEQNWWYA